MLAKIISDTSRGSVFLIHSEDSAASHSLPRFVRCSYFRAEARNVLGTIDVTAASVRETRRRLSVQIRLEQAGALKRVRHS
jgi:hypothetical protein